METMPEEYRDGRRVLLCQRGDALFAVWSNHIDEWFDEIDGDRVFPRGWFPMPVLP